MSVAEKQDTTIYIDGIPFDSNYNVILPENPTPEQIKVYMALESVVKSKDNTMRANRDKIKQLEEEKADLLQAGYDLVYNPLQGEEYSISDFKEELEGLKTEEFTQRAFELADKCGNSWSKSDLFSVSNWIKERIQPGNWGNFKSGVSEKIKEREKAQREAKKLAKAVKNKSLLQVDIPASIPVYRHENNKTIWEAERGDAVVCSFVARISKEIQYEDDLKVYQIEGVTYSGKWFDLDIPATDFTDNRKLIATIENATGVDGVVYAGMESHLRTSIKTGSQDAVRVKAFRRTGWYKDSFLIPGLANENIIEPPQRLPFKVSPNADLKKAVSGLSGLIKTHDPGKTIPVINHVLGASMARPAGLGDERYTVFITGRTGALKTSFTQCSMSMWGEGFSKSVNLIKLGELGSTKNAIETLAAGATDLPFFIDNYKPSTMRNSNDIIKIIHAITEGSQKNRLNRAGKEIHTKPYHCWPIITGEDLPQTDAASLARVLIIQFPSIVGHNEGLQAAQDNTQHLSAIGRDLILWLQSEEGKGVVSGMYERFIALRKLWSKWIVEKVPNVANANRLASNIAYNQSVFEALLAYPTLQPVLTQYQGREDEKGEYEEGLANIALDGAQATSESLEAQTLLYRLSQLLTAEHVVLLQRGQTVDGVNALSDIKLRPDQVIGWRDEDGVYLLMSVALKAVNQGAEDRIISAIPTLNRQFKELGLLASSSGGRLQKQVSNAGAKTWATHLHKKALGMD